MARIFITGSSDGLGQLAARALIDQGHRVVLHARNQSRADDAAREVPDADGVLIADFSRLDEIKRLAEDANATGRFDAVIHNAGIYHQAGNQDGLPVIFTVNTVAPYLLTALMLRPQRLIYLSSDMHRQANTKLDNVPTRLGVKTEISYSDTKFHDLLLAKTIARIWPDVASNALHPGWVPTKMGGDGAPDDLVQGFETQVWLSAGESGEVTGQYFFHKKPARYHDAADDVVLQDQFVGRMEMLTRVRIAKN